ncbi:hypothetical protein ACWD4J_38595 [Streptomyces sp. NPDC002577]
MPSWPKHTPGHQRLFDQHPLQQLPQAGDQLLEARHPSVERPRHVPPGGEPGAAGLAAYSADRLPRTSANVRKAAQDARLPSVDSRPAVAMRTALMSAFSRLGPGLLLRTFDGIADGRPPQQPYASGTRDRVRTRPGPHLTGPHRGASTARRGEHL